jgi:hypothetical protein
MSVSTLNDPLGVGFNQFNSTGGRADDVSGVNPYQDQSLNQWINPAAFVNPPNNLDRTHAGQFGAQVGNLFNHANYAPPFQLTLGVPGFAANYGHVNSGGASPRAIQLTARFSF